MWILQKGNGGASCDVADPRSAPLPALAFYHVLLDALSMLCMCQCYAK